MSEQRTLLVVEDNDEDFTALKRVMRQLGYPNPIYRATDGDDALAYLYHHGAYANTEVAPSPDLILLDLNLPGTDGREVIQQVKQDTMLRSIPIIVLTSSSNPKDVQTSYLYGANSYLLKPVGIDAFKRTIEHFLHYWLEISLLR